MIIQKGTKVVIKGNIRKSLMAYGNNQCKSKFSGQTRTVSKRFDSEIYSKIIRIERTREERQKYRTNRESWKFHIDDIILSDDLIPITKSKSELFDIKQLDI